MNKAVADTVNAWEQFCERLKAAGSVLSRETGPKDQLSLAEGLRKLVRLIRIGFDASLEYADADFPQLYQLVTPTTLGEGETSDAHYHQAMIDGRHSYRVKGKRGTAPFIEFTVYAGKIGLDERCDQLGALTERDLKVDADGSYELILSPQPHEGNWIKTPSEATVLYIRQYAYDWSMTTDDTFTITNIGTPANPKSLDVDQVRDALERTATYVARSINTWSSIVDYRRSCQSNKFFEFDAEKKDSDAPELPSGHRFSSGYFRLEADEALVVTLHPEEVPYWGLDITNYWFEPMSYSDHRSHVNNRTAVRRPDGSVRIVVCGRNPAVPNWIDTKGHAEGVLLFRWSRTAKPLPQIAAEVVPIDGLKLI